MAEHPILFDAEMVRAIRDGRKTQARRVVKPQPPHWMARQIETGFRKVRPVDGNLWGAFAAAGPAAVCQSENMIRCPYGQPGDLLVPRTTWAVGRVLDHTRPLDLPPITPERFWSCWDGPEKPIWCGKSRPGRFLPKTMWHLLPRLEVLSVRYEQVQEIGKDGRKAHDVLAEGISRAAIQQEVEWFHPDDAPAIAFTGLWDSTYAKRGYGWAANPWVWVVEFSRQEPEGGEA